MKIDQLEQECRTYCRYLAGVVPGHYLQSRYRDFHERAQTAAGWDFDAFDRFLVEFSARSPFLARLADTYASRFRKHSVLRKKLVLVLALLECSRESFARLDCPDPGGMPAAMLKLASCAALYAGVLALSLLLLLPVQGALALFARPMKIRVMES